MGKKLDLKGKRFDRVLVIKETNRRSKNGAIYWECLCDCGNIVEITTSNLLNGHTKSCGCLRIDKISGIKNDLKNQIFGEIIITDTYRKDGRSYCTGYCSCGNKVEDIRTDALINGSTLSCGHVGRENRINANTTHGLSNSGPYKSWLAMKQRCYNTNTVNYHRYGGRGIKVCKSWHSFVNFRKWALLNGWQENLTIDKIDNDGNYCPENCRWITRAENASKGAKNIMEIS